MPEPIDPRLLAVVVGGRTSASSQAELIPLLKQTSDAVKALARDSGKTDSSSQMMPMMMMMMMRR